MSSSSKYKAWAPPNPKEYKRLKRLRLEEEARSSGASSNQGTPDISATSRSRKRIRTVRPPALIERLPTEILEQILFFSKNLNFPKSSLRIGYVLSHPSFLSELTITAFAPTWKLWLGHTKKVFNSYYGFAQDYARLGGDPDFQSDVLACRWMNIGLLHRAQESWCRRNGREPPSPSAENWDDNTTSFSSFDMHFEHFTGSVRFAPFAYLSRLNGDMYRVNAHLDMHLLTRIPDHLLTGPFDWEKAKFLFWFVRNGGRVMPLSSPHYQSWELTKRGYDRIVTLKDATMAHVLLCLFRYLRVFEEWPHYLKREVADEAHRLQHLDLKEYTFEEQLAYLL